MLHHTHRKTRPASAMRPGPGLPTRAAHHTRTGLYGRVYTYGRFVGFSASYFFTGAPVSGSFPRRRLLSSPSPRCITSHYTYDFVRFDSRNLRNLISVRGTPRRSCPTPYKIHGSELHFRSVRAEIAFLTVQM